MDPAFLVKLSLEADKQRWICDFTLQYEVYRAAPQGLVEDHNSAKLNNYLLSNCLNREKHSWVVFLFKQTDESVSWSSSGCYCSVTHAHE